MAQSNLWVSRDGRWFDVPPERELPEGSLVIVNLLGERREVDPDALSGLEIDRERAEASARQQLVAWLGQADRGLGGLRSLLSERGRGGASEGLEPLQRLLAQLSAAMEGGDPASAAPSEAPAPDLEGRLRRWAQGVVDDPSKVEELRRIAERLERAAEALRREK